MQTVYSAKNILNYVGLECVVTCWFIQRVSLSLLNSSAVTDPGTGCFQSPLDTGGPNQTAATVASTVDPTVDPTVAPVVEVCM
jgi:hypothetical protein